MPYFYPTHTHLSVACIERHSRPTRPPSWPHHNSPKTSLPRRPSTFSTSIPLSAPHATTSHYRSATLRYATSRLTRRSVPQSFPRPSQLPRVRPPGSRTVDHSSCPLTKLCPHACSTPAALPRQSFSCEPSPNMALSHLTMRDLVALFRKRSDDPARGPGSLKV